MAEVKPFRALRPVKDKAGQISAQPYDSSHPEISTAEFQNNPFSYLHVVKSYMDFSDEVRNPSSHFSDGLAYLEKLKSEGQLIRETKPAFYIYRLIRGSTAFTTLIASAAIDDYLNEKILKHENILTEKLGELVEHISFFNSMGNPVLLTYPDNEQIDLILDKYIHNHAPEYNFISINQMKHNLWVVEETEDVRQIEEAFRGMTYLYIADGHHRSAGAAAYCEKVRSELKQFRGDEAFNFFPACLIPFSKLQIHEYHRLIKDEKTVNDPTLLYRLSEFFIIKDAGNIPIQPLSKGEMGIYFNRKSFQLRLKPELIQSLSGLLDHLDVSIVEEFILRKIFNIHDSKSDRRLSFLDGSKGLGNLQKWVDSGEQSIAITLYPTSIEELKMIADARLIMPPKSTWIEPKIRTGLVIYETL